MRIIAEAGVNHNGSLERALEMVDAAAAAGADAVKFQSFDPAALVTGYAEKAAYQGRQTGEGTQLEMLSALALDESAHRALIARCDAAGIQFLSSAFDIESVELLVRLGLTEFKLSSGEITDLPVLRAIAPHASSVLLSTGMATISEIAEAIDALVQAGLPRDRVTLLHCTTEYPAPPGEINLRAMAEMGAMFGLPIGYSDHTEGNAVSIAAAALGAVVLEKHFTLDRTLPGPDHAASLEPTELAELVSAVRVIEQALGSSHKQPTPTELKNAGVVRKSIVAARPIDAGEVLTDANLAAKRPGTGINPMRWDDVVGRVASRHFDTDEMIEL